MAITSLTDRPYAPEAFQCDLMVLHDVLSALSHLQHLHLVGKLVVDFFLDYDFFDQKPLQLLRLLSLVLLKNEDYDSSASPSVTARLSDLPSLDTLLLTSSGTCELPIDLLNLTPPFLAPRSFHIKGYRLEQSHFLSAETRVLFQSFSALRTLSIGTLSTYPNLVSDLALLPPTLTRLALALGRPCPDYVDDDFPKLENDPLLPIFQPNLQHLHFEAAVSLSPSSLDLIASFPALRCLHFGPHVDVDQRLLLSLIQRAEDGFLPDLRRLAVTLCSCTIDDKTKWSVSFSRWEAKKVARAAAKAGIELSGSMMCDLVGCSKDHCVNWCSDVHEGV
jgi:hypothetical protein